jgi:Flp pilus assembly protein TadB
VATPGPTNLFDLVHRHLLRATDDEEMGRRYRRLIWDLCALVLLCGSSLVLGIIAVIYLTGQPMWVAAGVALLGTATSSGTAMIARRRRAARALRTTQTTTPPGQ